MEREQQPQYKLDLKQQLPELAKDFQTINCPQCEQQVSAADININDKIAKCGSCDVVFSFEQAVADLMNSGKSKQAVNRPAGIDRIQFRDELEISVQQPWTVLEVLAITVFPIFAVLFTLIFFKKGVFPAWLPISLWIASVPAILNGVFRSRQKVHFVIGTHNLHIQWRPKKFNRDQSIPIGQIDQLYVKGMTGYHGVYMILNEPEGQKHVCLINGLDSLSKAHYLEQEIEGYLGIVDREVPEEKEKGINYYGQI